MRPYLQPMGYALSAIAGLVLALLTEGAGDVVALVLLAAPLVGIAAAFRRARKPAP